MPTLPKSDNREEEEQWHNFEHVEAFEELSFREVLRGTIRASCNEEAESLYSLGLHKQIDSEY